MSVEPVRLNKVPFLGVLYIGSSVRVVIGELMERSTNNNFYTRNVIYEHYVGN